MVVLACRVTGRDHPGLATVEAVVPLVRGAGPSRLGDQLDRAGHRARQGLEDARLAGRRLPDAEPGALDDRGAVLDVGVSRGLDVGLELKQDGNERGGLLVARGDSPLDAGLRRRLRRREIVDGRVTAASVGTGAGNSGLPVIDLTTPVANAVRAVGALGSLRETMERWDVFGVLMDHRLVGL